MKCLRNLLVLISVAALIGGCTWGASVSRPSLSSGFDSDSVPSQGITSWVITTQGEGPRWIGWEWWQALGLEGDQLGHEYVRLEREGYPIPTLWIDGPQGRGMLFYTKPVTGSLQTYRLTLEAQGVEMDILSTPDSGEFRSEFCQTTTTATARMESDQVYRSTAPLDQPWLWTALRPPQEFAIPVPLTDVVEAPVTMTLQMWGQSRMPVNPDHHLRVTWNDDVIDDRFWDGDNLEIWSLNLPESTEAENILKLSAPGETEAAVDMMWLDALVFQWRRRLALSVEVGWTPWTVESPSYACLGDLTDEKPVALLVDDQDNVYQGDIAAPEEIDGAIRIYQDSASRGWVGMPWRAPKPSDIRPWAGIDLDRPVLKDAEFVILADASAAETIQPLVDARAAEGLASLHLTPEAVYDSFGRGVAEVSAIREMILHLYQEGNLRYVLLIGDTAGAPVGHKIGRPNGLSIPTGWPRTPYVGRTASDSVIATDEEGKPVIAIGRIPVADVQALHTVIQKTLAWQPNSRIMFVNDDEREFVNLTDELAEISPPDLRVGTDEPDARQRVLDWLDVGPGMMVYSGHGSLPVLGDEKLLTWEDAGAWDGPTVVVAWSCLCASFAHPTHQSLAETWMLDRKGTVAFVGPTGETTTGEQRAMALAFQRGLREEARIGEAMLQAWRAAQSENVKAGFLLLGDPTLTAVEGSD